MKLIVTKNNITMKTLKSLILIIACVSFSCTNSQNLNNLSLDEFYNDISFNGISLSQIIDTHSESGNIQTLFNTPVSRSRDSNTTNSLEYEIEGYHFSFEELSSSDKDIDYSIAYIWISGSSKIMIKGVAIGIGDNISKLGDVTVLKPGNVVFYNEDTNASIDILYVNSIISKISFVFD